MPNCRRRFATEPDVKKHIDNHMNPHSSKSRRNNQMNNATAAAAAAAASTSMPSSIDSTKAPFQLPMDKQNNLIPRMNPSIKHELYFPQCYAPSFGNQSFGAQQQAHSSSIGTSGNNNSSVRKYLDFSFQFNTVN